MSSAVITVMTANVGAGLATDRKIEAAVRTAQPDIVAFEELPRAQAQRLRAALGDLYPATAFFADGHEGRGIISRHPILTARVLDIATGRPDCLAEIAVDGTELTVIVAHPRPQRMTRAGLLFDFPSRRQFLRLAQITRKAAPAVMMGDFNMSPRHPGYMRIRALGLVDAWMERGVGRGLTFPTRLGYSRWSSARIARGKVPPVVRFDYIWCTPDITVEKAWIGPDAGSDHATVLARLSLPPAPPRPPSQ
jgi:endonuclease/exonuclease/phosphatase family metal-dependent hydrolase